MPAYESAPILLESSKGWALNWSREPEWTVIANLLGVRPRLPIISVYNSDYISVEGLIRDIPPELRPRLVVAQDEMSTTSMLPIYLASDFYSRRGYIPLPLLERIILTAQGRARLQRLHDSLLSRKLSDWESPRNRDVSFDDIYGAIGYPPNGPTAHRNIRVKEGYTREDSVLALTSSLEDETFRTFLEEHVFLIKSSSGLITHTLQQCFAGVATFIVLNKSPARAPTGFNVREDYSSVNMGVIDVDSALRLMDPLFLGLKEADRLRSFARLLVCF